jgi:hypothetical protein
MRRFTVFTSVAVLITATVGSARLPSRLRTIQLNSRGLQHARQLISEGHVTKDKHGAWAAHRPSAEKTNQFVGKHGFTEFGDWYLGVDESLKSDSKTRYKFPYGDFDQVHRCALLAIISRARQYGYGDIEQAAGELVELLDRRDRQASNMHMKPLTGG